MFCVLAQAEVRYTITDIGTMPGTTSSQAVAINNNNQIAGFCDAWEHAFFWEDGAFTDIGSFGGTVRPCAINENGQITGTSGSPTYPHHRAFVWESGDTITDIGNLGFDDVDGYDINNAGQIVGQAHVDKQDHAFVWQNDVMTDLGPGRAIAINKSGLIAGLSYEESIKDHAVLWEEGSITDLGLFGGGFAEPHGINDNGQVILLSLHIPGAPTCSAFLYDNGTETNLGSLAGFNTNPFGINNTCQIVGESYLTESGPETAAFLWENGTIYNLNDLIPDDSGWLLRCAEDINDNGYIVGYGYNPDGDLRGFLLVPEPCTLSLLVLGGIGLVRRRRR